MEYSACGELGRVFHMSNTPRGNVLRLIVILSLSSTIQAIYNILDKLHNQLFFLGILCTDYKFHDKGIDERVPKPPGPPKPPKPPSGGGGGNTNNCNTLCNAIVANLALVNALNAAGNTVHLELNYNETPTHTVVLTVTGVNLQNCTITGIDQATLNKVTVSCAFAFANYTDMQLHA